MIRKALSSLVFATVACGIAGAAWADDMEIRWGTSRLGSSGHKALTNLSEFLNKDLKGYKVSVQPTPGGIISVKGYATEKFDGYFGSDVAFYEYAKGVSRFKGFKEAAKRAPVQSLWTFTLETGMAIHKRDKDKIKSWGDLAGKKVFTGPRPWDTRAQVERALEDLGVKHEYLEVDIGTAGSLLESGRIDALTVYTSAESSTAPWITEASLTTDWILLAPSKDELAKLEKDGFAIAQVKPTMFKKDVGTDSMTMLPFYYGLHVGINVPEDAAYQILKIVEANAAEMAKADKGFKQLADDMVGMQKRGIAAAVDFVEIHPGLAKFMKEKGAWDPKWEARVAKPQS